MFKNSTKPTLSIGIPAYNEQNNISKLIFDLLKQERDHYILKKIFVVSDASSDRTNNILRSIKSEYLHPIFLKTRQGQPHAQNIIIKKSNTDLLLLINADTKPDGLNFIDSLVVSILKDRSIGIVSAETKSQKPELFFEKIVVSGREFKKDAYIKWENGNNIYLCHGRARLIAKSLYKQIHFPEDCPEDSYSYLFCIKKGYKFHYVNDAKILFKSPNTYKDHKRQSNRFFNGKKNLNRYFDNNFIRNEYDIPKILFIKSFFKNIQKYHFYLIMYLLIFIFTTFSNKGRYTSLWHQIGSSK